MSEYNCEERLEVIKNILNQDNSLYNELQYIPKNQKLTLENGFYIPCSALFVDLRGSSDLTDLHRRHTLAKIYRIFINETIKILKTSKNQRHIRIVGDCVQCVFNTPNAESADEILILASQISSLIDFINKIFKQNDITQQNIGIGIAYGTVLMIIAGDEIDNEIVWMGKVLNEACKLCNCANKYDDDNYTIRTNKAFYNKLTQNYKKYLKKSRKETYGTDIIDGNIEKQIKELFPEKTILEQLKSIVKMLEF